MKDNHHTYLINRCVESKIIPNAQVGGWRRTCIKLINEKWLPDFGPPGKNPEDCDPWNEWSDFGHFLAVSKHHNPDVWGYEFDDEEKLLTIHFVEVEDTHPLGWRQLYRYGVIGEGIEATECFMMRLHLMHRGGEIYRTFNEENFSYIMPDVRTIEAQNGTWTQKRNYVSKLLIGMKEAEKYCDDNFDSQGDAVSVFLEPQYELSLVSER